MSDLNVSIRIRANADGSLSVINGVGNSIQNAGRQADQTQNAMERLSSSIARVGHYAVGAFAGTWAAGKLSEVVMLADKMTLLDSRIKIASSSTADYVAASQELVAISLRTGTSFEANATIFARVNKAMEQMGGSVRNTLALTETLSQSIRISGASSEEAASTIRQLSQALASGVLRGDEFNSMMENAPRLAQALSDGMHVSIGALRAMAEAGELTSKKVIEAIQSQGSVVNAEFAKIPLTVGAAMENINTAFGQYVMQADKGAGATAGLAQQINALAHNLTPVIDGLVTLGKVAATIFAGQLVTSMAAYITARRAAAAAEAAHSLAIAENSAMNIASIQSTIGRLEVQLGYIRAQQATLTAERAVMLSTVASSEATMNQARATLVATDAMIQSTSVIYIRRQALAAMAGAEVVLTATETELASAQARQLVLSEQIAMSMTAQNAAVAQLARTEGAAAVATGILSAELSLASVAMAGLNIAMGVFIGWQIGSFLNEFVVVQNLATIAVNFFVKTFETLIYVKDKAILLVSGEIEAAKALRVEHEKSMVAHDELTMSIVANNLANEDRLTLSADMKTALDALKTPQEVYNQSIRDATEAGKANLITEEQRLQLGVKALEKWQQASAAEANAKLTDAGKEIVKLQDEYDKLTMSAEKYNQVHASATDGTQLEKAHLLELKNALVGVKESRKLNAEAIKDSAAASKKANDEEDSFWKKALGFLQGQQQQLNLLKLSGKEKLLETEISKNLNTVLGETYDKTKALSTAKQDLVNEVTNNTQQIYAETEAQALQQKGMDAAKSEMDSLKDRYNQLTLSARDYYAAKLQAAGVATKDAAPLIAQFDKNSKIENQNKGIESASKALDDYNKKLFEANSKTADLGGVTSAVFDGALGGINAVAGAFEAMVLSIQKNNSALAENTRMKQINDAELDPVKNHLQAKVLATEEERIKNAQLKSSLTGIRQVASATGAMYAENTTARKAFNIISLAASVAERMADIAGLVPKAAGAVLEQGQGDPYTAFARIAAMAAIVGSIISAGGGGGFNFSGASTAKPPPTSPDSGTVLGDSSAKSDSVGKTYQLLKDIHASEYVELRGINSGVAALSNGITDVITRLFQAGGLSTDVKLQPTKMTGLAAYAPIDPISNWLISSVLGGKKSQEQTGGGLATSPTSLAAIRDGGNLIASQYATIKTTTKGGWFSSDKVSYSTQSAAIDQETQKAMNSVFKSMGDTMFGVAQALGGDLKQRVNAYIIPAMTVELRGLNGEDAAKKLNGVISTALDTMSTVVFGDIIGQYQKLGEGMLETAVRIVAEVAVVKDTLSKSGLSLAANALAISDAMIQAAGGIAEFQKSFDRYYDKFYTDTEKQTRLQDQLNNTLLDGLVVLPQTREGYRKLIESLNLTIPLDQQRYSLLLKLSEAADTYYAALEQQMTTAKDNLSNAYKRESDALTTTINKFDAFSKSLRTFRDSLLAGDLSSSPEAKYQAAQAAFNANNLAISAGAGSTTASKLAFDTALGTLQANTQTFLSASRDYSATAVDYATDYGRVMAALNSGIALSDTAKSDATLQLDQLKASVSGLITINESVLTVRDAILAIQLIQTTRDSATASATLAVSRASIPQFATGGDHSGGWRVVGENGPELERTGPSRIFSNGQSKSLVNNDELIAEIAKLREEARANAIAIAKAAADTAKILARWEGGGMPVTRVEA